MNYTHLTEVERYQIQALLEAGLTVTAIADQMNRHKSTISREIGRNCSVTKYSARAAQIKARRRCANSGNARQIPVDVWHKVECRLRREWSPEQISGRFKRDGIGIVSHEAIYRYVYRDKREGGQLHCHLRCQKSKRRRYGAGYDRRGRLHDRIPISERPAIVEQRLRIGDWEGDTVLGKRGMKAMVTLVDRVSRYTLIGKVERRNAPAVSDLIVRMLRPWKQMSHTLTCDNGKEFAGHRAIAKRLQIDCYFADPYASWQRGTNEQTNGLIRQYVPKSTDLDIVSSQDINRIMDRLNHRPRKTLNWRTPFEVMMQACCMGVALGS
jgi:transposase, IS30 family